LIPFVSVVIIPVNCLDASNREQNAGGFSDLLSADSDCEVIVVASGESANRVSPANDRLRYIRCAENETRAERKNVGWRAAKGANILFVNCGTPTAKSMARMIESTSGLLESAVILRPSLLSDSPNEGPDCDNPKSTLDHKSWLGGCPRAELGGDMIPRPRAALIHNTLPRDREVPSALITERFDLFYQALTLLGRNYLVSHSQLEQCGGFDCLLEEGEDIDLGIRLWETGASFTTREISLEPCCGFSSVLNEEAFLKLLMRHPFRQLVSWYRAYSAEIQGGYQNLAHTIQMTDDAVGMSAVRWLLESSLSATKVREHIRFDHSMGSLLEFYNQTSFVPKTHIRAYIELAIRQGLCTLAIDGRRRFDFYMTSNWLRNRTPFYEDLLQESLTRNSPTAYLRSSETISQTSLKYEGSYEIFVEEGTLDRDHVEHISNVPLPITCACQSSVKFLSCNPPDLFDYANDAMDLITKYEWKGPESKAHISYNFTCVVHEVVGRSHRSIETDKPDARLHLSKDDLSLDPKKLDRILDKFRSSSQRPLELARKVYDWVIDNTKFGTNGKFSSGILDTGMGNCVDRTRLFITLCRLQGIPARERCGATLLQAPNSPLDSPATHTGLGFSPLMHMWAEFYAEDYGWLPVEFLGQSFGSRSMSRGNVLSGKERERLVSDTVIYDEYYFGNLDPHRVHVRTPLVGSGITARIRRGQNHLDTSQANLQMRHRLTMRLVGTKINKVQ
jgi:hypothetical protein